MASAIDPITRKKLILIKELYQRAVVESAAINTMVSRIMSIIGFDLSAETALKAVVSHLEPSKEPSDSYNGLIQQADKLLKDNGYDEVPDKVKIRHVHSIRNDAQHKAKYPNESDVGDCRTYTRDFLEQIVKNVWKISFEKVSLTELIRNEKTKELLEKAEAALTEGDCYEAVNFAAIALNRMLHDTETKLSGREVDSAKAILIQDMFGKQKASKEAAESFHKMRHTLLMLALGLNPSSHSRFTILTMTEARKKKCDANDADFVVTYSIHTCLEVENRADSLHLISSLGI
jgi:hypothetical protein